jgi:hypothetical protein
MSQADRTATNVEPLFHPVSHYESPADVLNDPRLSTDEKRVILSSWASDMYVVESHPALREVPGIPQRLRLDDILAALKQLDDDTDPPPRGGLAMRLPRFNKLERYFRRTAALYRQARSDEAASVGASVVQIKSFTVDPRAAISQAPEYPPD